MSTKYRPDVDGLRALAIVPVVLFHGGLQAFSGGFVGVDVFFVISGFLITSILADEIGKKRFSLIRFYERRCRRILPALFVVMAVVYLAGLVVLLPRDYVMLSKSSIATVLFGSNVFFWYSSSDYFETATDMYPLLHTWSLAIEEQFYVIFPLLLAGLMWVGRRAAFWTIAVLCMGSFALCIYITRVDPPTAFYLTPMRAWELGLGSLVALWYGRWPLAAVLREVAAAGGLLAIAFAVLTYDDSTAFPGYAAMLPAIGAATIIAAGKGGQTLAGRVLSLRPVVFIGLISYSLYLWHWPILAYLHVLTNDAPLSPILAGAAIAASAGLAVVSWAYVEAPFRKGPPVGMTRRTIFASSAVSAALVAGFAAASYGASGWPVRFSGPVLAAEASANDFSPYRQRCFENWPHEGLCTFPGDVSPKAHLDFLLWGDSHADAMMPGITNAAGDAGLVGMFAGKSACPPLLGIIRGDKTPRHRCDKFNDEVLAVLRSRDDMPVVILAARWPVYAEGYRAPGEEGAPILLARPGTKPAGPQANYALFKESLEATVEKIRATGRKVILMGGVPEIGWNVPRSALANLRWGKPLPDAPTVGQVESRQERTNQELLKLGSLPGVYEIPIAPELCRPVCRTRFDDGWSLYFDDDHLTARGAHEIIAPLVRNVFDKLVAAGAFANREFGARAEKF